MAPPADSTPQLPDYLPVPEAALGPALNEQGYFVGRVARNLFWVTDGTYQSAFLATPDGVVLFDAPPTIGHNLRRAVDEVAAAEGVGNTVTHLVYSHHHADHAGAANLFGDDIVRIGHAETRRLLLRDNDANRPAPEVTYSLSKAALVHLTRVLDLELRPLGIRVNAVAPQLISTAETRQFVPADLLAHAVLPEAIADVIAYLVRDAATPVSGAVVPVYGA
jgi:NAD(P)-dependent dehydrogenase (short-subunit alcohol dehydrogenase family)